MEHKKRTLLRKVGGAAVVSLLALIATLILLVILGYIYKWEWVGVGEAYRPMPPNQDIRREKTLWDWMDLLVVPVVLGIGGVALNQRAKRREERAEERAKERTLLLKFYDDFFQA